MRKIIIAIDGYAGCGKSTTAKKVAEALNYAYIDTGAMYRAVTLYFITQEINLQDIQAIQQALQNIQIHFQYNPAKKKSDTYLNGKNVEDEIRKMYVSKQVSQVSAIAEVRQVMVAQQQQMGENKGIVMDGRDIGTHVFPQAELKIFMSAAILTRAKRRQLELQEKGQPLNIEEIIQNLESRDHIDTHRKENPLRRATDAYHLDTSSHTIESQSDYVIALAKKLENELEIVSESC